MAHQQDAALGIEHDGPHPDPDRRHNPPPEPGQGISMVIELGQQGASHGVSPGACIVTRGDGIAKGALCRPKSDLWHKFKAI